MNSKEYFFNEVIKEAVAENGGSVKVLELGCGKAEYVPSMIEKYPQLEYVGIEPIEDSFLGAKKNLEGVPRTNISSQLGYDSIDGLEDESFDIIISFSVLEHVKHLDRFLKMSARYVKKGGRMVHRYDLGHALYPWSLKETLHVFLGNHFSAILPERQFVRYVPMDEVEKLYRKFTIEPDRYTYHQMRSHKALEKGIKNRSVEEIDEVMEDVYTWEFDNAEIFGKIPLPERELLFPTVAVWGRKK